MLRVLVEQALQEADEARAEHATIRVGALRPGDRLDRSVLAEDSENDAPRGLVGHARRRRPVARRIAHVGIVELAEREAGGAAGFNRRGGLGEPVEHDLIDREATA